MTVLKTLFETPLDVRMGVEVYLDDPRTDNVFQPDVSFIRQERLHLAERVYFPGPPDIAIEITSPSSQQYDQVEKKINYGRFGVREYWLIDPLAKQATFYHQTDGQLIPILAQDERFWSRRSYRAIGSKSIGFFHLTKVGDLVCWRSLVCRG